MKHHPRIARLVYWAMVLTDVWLGTISVHAESQWEAGVAQRLPGGGRLAFCQQLPTSVLTLHDPMLPAELKAGWARNRPRAELPGRRVPELVSWSRLLEADLRSASVPLSQANTLAHLNYQQRRFGRLMTRLGEQVLFNPEVLLVRFGRDPQVSALRVPSQRELECARVLARRPDVTFVELDTYQRRLYSPNDPLITNQWHHQKLGSYAAWNQGLGRSSVQIAIVDTPFQMDHPDLAANTLSGWDAVANVPITSSSGIDHSTLSAGMAAAVIGNGIGVAGAGNCGLVPINIDGTISQMYDAVLWAADHGIRVVNISWTGGDSPTLNQAGTYLRTNSSGILAMAGGNLPGDVDPNFNQPDIWCISMTDAADLVRSESGAHIDFAAPGYLVFSTTTNSAYSFCAGTSFSTPLFCGVVAVLMSLNPTLTSDDVIGILKNTATDLGQPGWDSYYGWGRLNFAAAAAATVATLPVITGITTTNNQVVLSTTFNPALSYSLWSSPMLPATSWTLVTDQPGKTNGAEMIFTDPVTSPAGKFYRVDVARKDH